MGVKAADDALMTRGGWVPKIGLKSDDVIYGQPLLVNYKMTSSQNEATSSGR